MLTFSEFQDAHPRESGQPRGEYERESSRAYAGYVLNEVQYDPIMDTRDRLKDTFHALNALCEVIRALHGL